MGRKIKEERPERVPLEKRITDLEKRIEELEKRT